MARRTVKTVKKLWCGALCVCVAGLMLFVTADRDYHVTDYQESWSIVTPFFIGEDEEIGD